MPLGPSIVTFLRLVVPLSIFRWPLGGTLASMLLDGADVILITFINRGDFSSYHSLDKNLDMYYLFFAFLISLRWTYSLAKKTSIFLFLYRLSGFVLFEATGIRLFLFIFPNLFENFYIFYLVWLKFFGAKKLTFKKLIIVLLILLIPKMGQEYVLHYKQYQPWNWFKAQFLHIQPSPKPFELETPDEELQK